MALFRTVAQDHVHSVGYAAKPGIHRLPSTALVVNSISRMDIEKLMLIVDVEICLLPSPACSQLYNLSSTSYPR